MTRQKQAKLSDIRADLEYHILKGLSSEWDAALWVLDDPYHRMMKKPLFSLGDALSAYGSWSHRKREIRISRRLVEHHSWESVRDVLRHEMAHQMAHEVFGAVTESAHGPVFKKCCGLLRANPRASGTYPALDRIVFHIKQYPEDAKLRQIIKLLALAESRNSNEAEAAMAKAHELIAKYNVMAFDNPDPKPIHSIFLGRPALRRSRDVYTLARLICDFYFVEGIWVPAFAVEKGKMGNVLEISGTAPNLQMADYVYHYVRRFIDTQWVSYNATKKLKHHRKPDFAVGIIDGFRAKLAPAVSDSDKNNPSGIKDLVNLKDARLKNYITHRYPRTQKIYRNTSLENDGVLQDGVRVGKTLVISKGVSHTRITNRLLTE
jgi:hypothetical protein